MACICVGQACIIIPVPTGERRHSGNLISAAVVDAVDERSATRADVLMNLGPPDIILGDDEAFIYTGDISGYAVLWAVGMGAPGGGVGAGAAVGGIETIATMREWVVFLFEGEGNVIEVAVIQDSISPWGIASTKQLDEWVALHCPQLVEQLNDQLALNWRYMRNDQAD